MSHQSSVVIPAAGNSVRMGTDKALLTNANGMTFAGHLVHYYGIYECNPVILVVNEQFDSPLPDVHKLKIIVNHLLGKGRSWSVYLGLQEVPEGNTCFIQNIDNPFIEPGLLDLLLDSVTPYSYVVPMYNGHGGHPILLGSKIVAFFRSQSDIPDFRQALHCFSRTEISYPDERILWNINTPAEYQRYIRVR